MIPSKEYYRKQYIGRINKALDFIDNNLTEELNLERIAEQANFSPFHFHRIFGSFLGETLNSYIRRRRLEKAGSLLLGNLSTPVNEVAVNCGFSSNAAFSRAFKEHFEMNATEWRNGGYDEYRKIRKLHSKVRKSNRLEEGYFSIEKLNDLNAMMTKVEVKELPELNVAYVRHTGAFDQIEQAYQKLFAWAGPRGLMTDETKALTVYHDDPKVTEIDKLRQSACIIVDENEKVDGEVGKMKVAAGRYAVAHFEITAEHFSDAWDAVMVGWMPESGYECADALPYELYYNDHTTHPEGKFIFDICVPVQPVQN